MRIYEVSDDATRRKFPLSPKKVIKKTLGASIVCVFLILCCTFLFIFWSFYVFVAITGILVTLTVIPIYIYERLYFKTYYYDVKTDELIIRKGVWAPKEIRVPYTKIQNVYVDRDMLDIIFGLYDVHLATADALSSFYAHIDGVDEKNAIPIRDMILSRVKKEAKENKSGV